MTAANQKCHACSGVMRRDARPMTITFRGEDATFELPGWYCESCDESVHSGKDMRVSDAALHDLKARVEGLLAAAQVRSVRKKLKLSQRGAGRLLGGGPNAFQKYESGATMVSRPMSNLLRLLASNPRLLEELRDSA